MRFILEKSYEKKQPTIDLLFPLTKLGQVAQPPDPNQVCLHHSTFNALQWGITRILKDFITCNPQDLKEWDIKTKFRKP